MSRCISWTLNPVYLILFDLSCAGSIMAERAEDIPGDGCKGPDSMYIKLISSDGEVFIKRKYAVQSPKLVLMIPAQSGPQDPYEDTIVYVNQIPSRILNTVCSYLKHKADYNGSAGPMEVPDFTIPRGDEQELMLAADYFEC